MCKAEDLCNASVYKAKAAQGIQTPCGTKALCTADMPRARVQAYGGPCPSPPRGWTWESLMECALAQAALGQARGEVPVGAVLVNAQGQMLAQAHNAPIALHDPTAHAEVLALRRAGAALGKYRLEGCTLVVTLEPCAMCAAAMVHARIAGLVYGAEDARAGAVTSCLDGLDLPFYNHKVWHIGGMLAARCAAQLRTFFANAR
jgi:tRNA(adenine34) deaminase